MCDIPFAMLGVDIGGTKVAVSLGLSDGALVASGRIDNRNRQPFVVIPEVIALGKKLLEENNMTERLLSIGVGSPAPIDIYKGVILGPTNLPQWKYVPIAEELQKAFGVRVTLENDANAAALAEWFFGSGKGCKNMIYIAASTGIGGGFIVNGRLMRGDTAAGAELHIPLDPNGPVCTCGIQGCYEAFCGGRAIAMRVQKELSDKPNHPLISFAGGLDKIDMIAIEKGVKAHEPYACAVWDQMCMRHAQAVGSLINIFNPEKIIFGTLAEAAGDLFMNPVKYYLPRFCWEQMAGACTLGTSALGRKIGEYSAIAIALNMLYEAGEWSPVTVSRGGA